MQSTFVKDDHRWLARCAELSINSDDPDTQLGCVTVNKIGEVCSEAWNSLARGVRSDSGRLQRPAKYFWLEHAERNAVYHAAREGTALNGCTLYVQVMPCADCARAIIQGGIAEVVVSNDVMDAYEGERYREHHAIAAVMLAEAGVEVRRA